MGPEVKHIQSLVDKFWAGETSLDEEVLLREYFKRKDYPAELEDAAAYFITVAKGRQTSLPGSFDDGIMEMIEPVRQRTSLMRWTIRIAASVVFIIGLVSITRWAFKPIAPQTMVQVQPPKSADSEVTLAYEQTRSALLLLSSKMNQATTTTAHFIEIQPTNDIP